MYVGFIYLALRHDFVEGTTSSPVAYIEGIFVEPDYRNRGLASLLVETAEDWGLRNGCKELGSDAELNNLDSIAFHKSAGFKEANRVVCFSKTIRE